MTSFNPLNFHRPSWIETHPFYLLAASNPVVDEKICPINNSVTDGLNVFDNDMVLPFTQYLAQRGIENNYSNDISLTLIEQSIKDSQIIEKNDVLPERLVVVEVENNIIRSPQPSPPSLPMILSQGDNDMQQPSGSEVDVELNIITPLPQPPTSIDYYSECH
ncbi:hypothetical protein TcasGA2_TC001663 [Tribolium castaneum]|uniref:Uncharacterized protein n=1 Tax=Tribolium castaneum TaxID=7070 RepID=D6X1L5_TRICA|nr:hypothetical protein TcasGA2_TC001663 [Tribolium castaneum]